MTTAQHSAQILAEGITELVTEVGELRRRIKILELERDEYKRLTLALLWVIEAPQASRLGKGV